MDVKEKLMELLRKPIFRHELADPVEAAADYLIANGVTVQAAPTITYEDLVPHGRWEKGKEKKLYCDWEMNGWYDYPELCTNCGYDAAEHGAGVGKFCPNCGAKMDGGKDNDG